MVNRILISTSTIDQIVEVVSNAAQSVSTISDHTLSNRYAFDGDASTLTSAASDDAIIILISLLQRSKAPS